MARPEGTRKTGGRKKGTPNRRTDQLAEQLAKFGLDVPAEIVKTLPTLAPETRVQVLMALMPFLYPKRKALEVSDKTNPQGPRITVNIPSNGREVREHIDKNDDGAVHSHFA